ncbi:cyclase family protein [Gallaecimonas sp. GXIMD4217]|uniref:cyclase family protein n=1 Tax=Gallaecimonas sp. GXIMD4217 TaxID=3131927 RepID=UPI00311AC008
MRLKIALPLLSMLLLSCAQHQGLLGSRWVDLSHDLSEQTLYWPTAERFKLDTVFEGATDKGFYYSAYQFCAAEHGGTHVDAPVHFARGRWSVDQIPLTQLVGQVAVVDVTEQAEADSDYQISVADLSAWERRHGRLADGVIVLFRTGFSRHWPNAEAYLGTARRGQAAVAELHFPGLAPEAATWLVNNRSVKAVGIDTASIDHGQSTLFGSHVTLMSANIPALENLTNLESLPATGAELVALPIKIKGGSGGPLRVAAVLPGK